MERRILSIRLEYSVFRREICSWCCVFSFETWASMCLDCWIYGGRKGFFEVFLVVFGGLGEGEFC